MKKQFLPHEQHHLKETERERDLVARDCCVAECVVCSMGMQGN